MSARRRLRARLARGGYLMAPGAHDVLTARLAQLAGFEAVYLSGGAYSRANGYPDIGLLTMSEVVHWISLSADAVEIPVIADADAGYGNALNVVRTVREFEKAGCAALHLEDQVSPKKCGHYEGKQVVPATEMVGKLKAALDARRDGDLVIIARTDARAIEGLDAAIERANRYLEAGADMAFVEAPQSAEELARVGREVEGPAVANVFEGGKTPALPAAALERLGFRLGIYPSQAHRAAIFAAQETLRALKEDGDTRRVDARLASFAEREAAVDAAGWRALEEKYLRLASEP